MLSETFLKSSHTINFSGYNLVRNDSTDNERGGGVALIIKNTLKIKQIKVPVLQTITSICATKIFFDDGDDVVFVSVYVSNSVNEIDCRDMAVLMRLGNKVVIGGDFNAKHKSWKCLSENTRGRTLERYIKSQNGRIKLHVPDAPTYYPFDIKRTPSYLDLCLTKNISVVGRPVSLCATDSDHNPILLRIKTNCKFDVQDTKLDYNKANWNIFEAEINRKLHDISESDQVENTIMRFTEAIHESEKIAVPRRRQEELIIPRFIREMISHKNQLRRKLQSSQFSLYARNMIRAEMNDLRATITKELHKWKDEKIKSRLKHIKPYDTKLFVTMNQLTKQKQTIPTLMNNDQPIHHSADKAQLLADIFEAVHRQNQDLGSSAHDMEVNTTVNNFVNQQSHEHIASITTSEVKNAINSLKNNKAPGCHNILTTTVKHLSFVAIIFITNIFNTILKESIFPACWKIANIIAFVKPGKLPTLPENYRPISLLPTLSKILEKIIAIRLVNELKLKQIIQPEQFGFQANHSTSHAIQVIKNDIINGFKNRSPTGMVLLDIQKAFDCVWHNGLIYKMIKIGISPYLIKLIYSYLKNRKFQVIVSGEKSTSRNIAAGVPQGSVLGPILFLIYLHDMPTHT